MLVSQVMKYPKTVEVKSKIISLLVETFERVQTPDALIAPCRRLEFAEIASRICGKSGNPGFKRETCFPQNSFDMMRFVKVNIKKNK